MKKKKIIAILTAVLVLASSAVVYAEISEVKDPGYDIKEIREEIGALISEKQELKRELTELSDGKDLEKLLEQKEELTEEIAELNEEIAEEKAENNPDNEDLAEIEEDEAELKRLEKRLARVEEDIENTKSKDPERVREIEKRLAEIDTELERLEKIEDDFEDIYEDKDRHKEHRDYPYDDKDHDDEDEEYPEGIRNKEMDKKLEKLVEEKQAELEKVNEKLEELKLKAEALEGEELKAAQKEIRRLEEYAEDLAEDVEDIKEDIREADYDDYQLKDNKAKNKVTKEELGAKKEERAEKKLDTKDYIKEIKRIFAGADNETKREILALIGELKRELKDESIGIFVRGKDVDFDKYNGIRPVIENERTLVPLRAVIESLKADVAWDEEQQKITITKGEIIVELTVDEYTAYVNGKEVQLEVAPRVEKGRTRVPLRFLAETFGLEVEWNEDAKTVIIED